MTQMTDDDAKHREQVRLEYERIMSEKARKTGKIYKPNLEATKFLTDMTEEEKIYLAKEKKRIELEKLRAEQTTLKVAKEEIRAKKAREQESREASYKNRLVWSALIVFFIFVISTCDGSGGSYHGYDDWYCYGARC
jgi:hypothetical protein